MESINKICLGITAIIVIASVGYMIGFSVKCNVDNNKNEIILNYNNKLDSIKTEIIKRDSIIIELKNNIKHDTEQAYKDSYNDAINKFYKLTSSNKNK